MLTEVFKTVLSLSAVGSILTQAIISIKPITARYLGHKFQYYIWIFVIISMTVFVHPMFLFDAHKLQESFNRFEEVRIVAEKTGNLVKAEAELYGRSISVFQLFSLMWFLGVICVVLALFIRYRLFKRELIKNSRVLYCDNFIHLPMEVLATGILKAPVLIGIFSPKLFIPDTITDEVVVKNILLHELTHCKRDDLLYKSFAVFVRCIHWFNPFAYIMVREIERECEISCDIETTQIMAAEDKRDYMRSIIFVFENAVTSNVKFGVGMAKKKSLLEKRFSAIEGGCKNKPVLIITGILFVFLMQGATVFAVNTIANIKPLYAAEQIVLPSKVEKKQSSIRIIEEKEEISIPHIEEVNIPKAALQNQSEKTAEPPKSSETAETRSFTEIESDLKKTGKEYIKTEFNYEGGDTRIIKGVMPDLNGCISVAVSSNANEIIEVSFADSKTGRVLNGARSFPVNKSGVCVIEDLDRSMKYDVIVKGLLRNNWEIESEIIIY